MVDPVSALGAAAAATQFAELGLKGLLGVCRFVRDLREVSREFENMLGELDRFEGFFDELNADISRRSESRSKIGKARQPQVERITKTLKESERIFMKLKCTLKSVQLDNASSSSGRLALRVSALFKRKEVLQECARLRRCRQDLDSEIASLGLHMIREARTDIAELLVQVREPQEHHQQLFQLMHDVRDENKQMHALIYQILTDFGGTSMIRETATGSAATMPAAVQRMALPAADPHLDIPSFFHENPRALELLQQTIQASYLAQPFGATRSNVSAGGDDNYARHLAHEEDNVERKASQVSPEDEVNAPSMNFLDPNNAVVTAENISALHLLSPVQSPPITSPAVLSCEPGTERTLPFEVERSLCGVFAFLSDMGFDSTNIPAVCLEEDSKKGALKILLATSKANHDDGRENMARIVANLERLLEILSRINDHERERGFGREILQVVVSICSNRIFDMVLGIISHERHQLTLTLLLRSVLDWLSGQPSRDSTRMNNFVTAAKTVIQLIDNYRSEPTDSSLVSVIDGIYDLSRVQNWTQLLADIPSSVMDPFATERLVQRVAKLARYRESSRHLYKSSQRFKILRRATVSVVDLGPDAFQAPSRPSYTPRFSQVVQRLGVVGLASNDLNRICQHLRTVEAGRPNLFDHKTLRTLTDAKVHAEIQLAYHYLKMPAQLPPRVICSRKGACYLCSLFLNMQNAFHAPHPHGRFYPAWRLPNCRGQKALARRFNEHLAEHIRKLLSGMRMVCLSPSESSLMDLVLGGRAEQDTAEATTALVDDRAFPRTLNVKWLAGEAAEAVRAFASSEIIEALPGADEVSYEITGPGNALYVSAGGVIGQIRLT